MFCENCGYELNPGDKLCPVCGTEVHVQENPAPEPGPDQIPWPAPEPEPGLDKPPEPEPAPAPKGRKILLAAAACIVLVILACIIYISSIIIFRKDGADAESVSAAAGDTNNRIGEKTVFDGAVLQSESSGVDLSSLSVIPIRTVTASSMDSSDDAESAPMRILDGRDDTCWREGEKGNGVGESLTIHFADAHRVSCIAFKLGDWSSNNSFEKNNVPKTLRITVGDFESKVTFSGKQQVELLEFTEPVNTDQLDIVIEDVYEGGSGQNTCINEITVYESV